MVSYLLRVCIRYLIDLFDDVIQCAISFVTVGFWYGAKLIREEGYNIGNVIIVSGNAGLSLSSNNSFLQVFFSIIIAVFNLGQAGPQFQALTSARAAAYLVWDVIDAVRQLQFVRIPCIFYSIL